MILLYILAALLTLLAVYILFLGACCLMVDPGREYEKNSPFYRHLLYSTTAFVLKLLRIRIHTTGLEKVPKNAKLLFVGNHRSNFDPIITWQVFRKWDIAFVSKPENFKIPFFGRIIRKCCFMAIDREDPRKAIVTIRKAAKLLEDGQVCVGVYPEGTRSKSGRLLPFHNGVFKIAQKAEATVVVVAVTGTETIHKRTPFRTSHVYVDVLDVIPAEEIKSMKTEMIGSRVGALLQEHMGKEDT